MFRTNRSVHINIKQTAAFLLACFVLSADAAETYTKSWNYITVLGPIEKNSGWHYYLESQLRFIDNPYFFNQLNGSLGLYYKANSELAFAGGYYRRYEKKTNGDPSDENRLWEQIEWKFYRSDPITMNARSRLEQRSILSESGISHRLREKITIKFSMLVIADEMFVQLNQVSWTSDSTFAENRASIGFEIPLSQNMSGEISYLHQYVKGSPNQSNNVLQLGINWLID